MYKGARFSNSFYEVSFAAGHSPFPSPTGMCRWRPEEALLPQPPGTRRTWRRCGSPVGRLETVEGFAGTYPVLEMRAWKKQVCIPFTGVLEGIPSGCYCWGRSKGDQRGAFWDSGK